MRLFGGLVLIALVQILSGCKAYKRDIILQFDENFSATDVEKSVDRANDNYIIQPGDYLQLNVFTNEGERIIDPNNELGGNNNQQRLLRNQFTYLVMADGTCRFPMVGILPISGLTIIEAEELIQEAFNDFYEDTFVKLQPDNRRVVLLGATGGGGRVIPLGNENINILEVLALAGGIEQGGDVKSIKLIRGDLNDPIVFEMDLSTITGLKKSGMIVEPGDIIYVEPWRRPFRQTLQDVSPAISLISSTITLIFVIQNATK